MDWPLVSFRRSVSIGMQEFVENVKWLYGMLSGNALITTCWSLGCLYVGAWLSHWSLYEKVLYNRRVALRIVPALVCVAALGTLHYYVALAVVLLAIVWSLVLPLPHEYVLLALYKKRMLDVDRCSILIVSTPALIQYYRIVRAKGTSYTKKLEADYDYWQSLKSLVLLPWEVRKYYLESLVVLHRIGAYNTLKEELEGVKSIAHDAYLYRLMQIDLAQDDFDYHRSLKLLKEVESIEEGNEQHLLNIYEGLIFQYSVTGEKENYQYYAKKSIELAENTKSMALNVLQNMMQYYDLIQDAKGADDLINKIRRLKFQELKTKLDYYDVIYHHYLVTANRHERIQLIEELMKSIDEMEASEDERIMSKIRMLRLYFENNYGWKEYSLSLFNQAEPLMAKSMDVAMTLMQVTKLLISQSMTVMGLSLDDKHLERLMKTILGGVACYEDELDKMIAETPDDFLYKKKSLLMMKADITFFKANVRFDMIDTADERLRYFERIIDLCNKNGQERELLHFMNVYVDDILCADRDMMAVRNHELPEWTKAKEAYKTKRQYYLNKAVAMMGEIDKVLAERNYDRSLNYYILYEAENYLKLGDMEHARFFFNEFKKYDVVIEYYPLATRQIYQRLMSKISN